MRLRWWSPILLLPVTIGRSDSVHLDYLTVRPEVVQQRLEMVKEKLSDRRATLEQLFHEVGCDGDRLTAQTIPHTKDANVICTMPSDGPRTIVVGGHYDLASRGMGVVDDWSGTALLPSLYQSLAGRPRRHRFVFVGFAEEERGLLGSKEYVHQLAPEQRASIAAMVNLECLGVSRPSIWQTRADKRLVEAYAAVARSIGQEPAAVNVERVGDDDSHSFLDAHVPVITFHSVTQQTFPILHSFRDTVKAIDQEQYYEAYRLAAVYLAYLDTVLD
jgi:hypothetical protein